MSGYTLIKLRCLCDKAAHANRARCTHAHTANIPLHSIIAFLLVCSRQFEWFIRKRAAQKKKENRKPKRNVKRSCKTAQENKNISKRCERKATFFFLLFCVIHKYSSVRVLLHLCACVRIAIERCAVRPNRIVRARAFGLRSRALAKFSVVLNYLCGKHNRQYKHLRVQQNNKYVQPIGANGELFLHSIFFYMELCNQFDLPIICCLVFVCLLAGRMGTHFFSLSSRIDRWLSHIGWKSA